MLKESYVDVAFDIVSKSSQPIAFIDLWKTVVAEEGITEEEANEKIGLFYTSLLLDGRFVNKGDNTWDLRSRYKFDKAVLDVNECYTEDDEEEVSEDPEEAELDSGEDDYSDNDEDEEEKDGSSDEEKSEYDSEQI